MSLNIIERRQTKIEFKRNIALIGMTNSQLASKLNISTQKLIEIIELKDGCIENPWIVLNFITTYAQTNSLQLLKFSKLKGDYHDYPFLDSVYIENGRIIR